MTEAEHAEAYRPNEAEVGLPPLNERRRDVYAYYRLRFLEDGYPGRQTDEGLRPHPIYGNYVITDYLAQYAKSKDPVYLDAARHVADAAISRMTEHEGGLAFWYEPADGISSLPMRFYSALTQARYLQVLGKLNQHADGERYRVAAQAIFRSLQVPVERGGVLRVHDPGVMIEEYAHHYPDYTLNGWTTAMLLIHEYGLSMPDPDAAAFFDENVRALKDVLPLYDVPELANSRYRLTGPAVIRMTFDAPGATIDSTELIMPRHGAYPVRASGAGRWENRYRSGISETGVVEEESVLAEVFLSMVTAPENNVLALSISTPRATTLRLAIGQGRYRPKSSYLAARSYAEFGSFRVQPGTNDIRAEVPWANARLVAYPTTFGKTIGGRSYNQYHFIHIDNLDKLFVITEEPMLKQYADLWRSYPQHWPEIAEYTEADIALDRYAPGAP